MDLIKNQVALALIVFTIIVVGAFWVLDGVSAKDVVIQVITAVCALVTGQQMEKSKVQRALEKVDELQADAKVEVARAETAKVVEKSKTEEVKDEKA